MRILSGVMVSLLVTGVASAAHGQDYYGGYDRKYQQELWKEQRECEKELDEAKNRREYNKARRECREEIAKVHWEWRGDQRDWNDERRWDRRRDHDDDDDD